MSVETQARPSPAQIRELLGLSPDRLFVVVSRLFALVALVVVLSLLSARTSSRGATSSTCCARPSPLFVMSAGLTLVVLTAGIDLSVGAVLGLAACVAASLITGGSPVMGILAALCRRPRVAGSSTALLVAYARIPPFIATYGMLWIANGIGLRVHEGRGDLRLAGGLPLHRHRHDRPDSGSGHRPAGDARRSPCAASPHATWPRHLRDRRQSGGGAAVGHAGRAPARHRLRAERAAWRHLPA